jgi:hypothetical protein
LLSKSHSSFASCLPAEDVSDLPPEDVSDAFCELVIENGTIQRI